MKRTASKSTERLLENLPVVMEAHGWDVAQLAKASGVSYRALMYYMSRERTPGLDIVDKIATAAGIDTLDLLAPGLTVDAVKKSAISKLAFAYGKAAQQERDYAQFVLDGGKSR